MRAREEPSPRVMEVHPFFRGLEVLSLHGMSTSLLRWSSTCLPELSKAIEDAPKEKAANSKAKTPDAIDPSAENDKIEKKEEVIDKNLRNRKSKFSVTGDIDYSGRNFRVGLFYGRQAQTKKREWLVYGIVDRFNLSELFNDLKDTKFDLTLENVALMAASKGYVDNNEINVKGYTIKDGMSLYTIFYYILMNVY